MSVTSQPVPNLPEVVVTFDAALAEEGRRVHSGAPRVTVDGTPLAMTGDVVIRGTVDDVMTVTVTMLVSRIAFADVSDPQP